MTRTPDPQRQVQVGPEVLDRAEARALLQVGVRVPALVPCTISDFLVAQLGIDPEVVARRITTIFVDGSVVDSDATTELRDGAVLALSAAMPGLVGATLRKGGYYAAMRAEITAHAGAVAGAARSGLVTVKLFNLLISELGPALLAHGLLLSPGEAAVLLGAPPAGDVLVRSAPERRT